MRGRDAGYAPIREYAAIGDGRTVALVASDGAIDWLCLPDLDSPSVFAALLDHERGGRFTLAPAVPHESTRRYLPGTNVLETTFTSTEGTVRVTDALTFATGGLAPYRELVRRVEGLAGRVPMQWTVDPRFEYGGVTPRVGRRVGTPVFTSGSLALAVRSWGAGEARWEGDLLSGSYVATDGATSLLSLGVAYQEPLLFPGRAEVEGRLEATSNWWSEWGATRRYDGPWRDAVVRSVLALKLLVHSPSGAIAAAATTSLPEEIGGSRNWDYRYSWPRDAAFALSALLALGCAEEARAFFWWLLHASQLSHPRIGVLYRLDGGANAEERSLPLAGYRGSRPVRIGNGAVGQTQLDVYGELLVAAARLADFEGGLDRDHGRRLAEVADFVCEVWTEPDAGIWESRAEPRHFTQSKMMCAVALERACELAGRGLIPAKHADRWRAERDRILQFVETQCYSERRRSYVRSAGEERLDAALLAGVLAGYAQPRSPRLLDTVDAITRELSAGAGIRRHLGDDGLPGEDGAFLPCSFWLVEAYAMQGRTDEAVELMDELVGLANDVGLYSEELDPETGDFLGNFPQGLTHLGLINAAVAIAGARDRPR